MGNGEGAAAWKKKKMAAVAGRSSRTGGVGGVLVARQLGLQALWTAILGFRAEKGHAARIQRHGRREGAGEGAGFWRCAHATYSGRVAAAAGSGCGACVLA